MSAVGNNKKQVNDYIIHFMEMISRLEFEKSHNNKFKSNKKARKLLNKVIEQLGLILDNLREVEIHRYDKDMIKVARSFINSQEWMFRISRGAFCNDIFGDICARLSILSIWGKAGFYGPIGQMVTTAIIDLSFYIIQKKKSNIEWSE